MSERDLDAELVARVARDDASAVRQLVARKLPRLLALAVRMLGDRMEAEDVAQEAFVRIWKQAPHWREGEARFDTWLHRVAMNLCYDRLRARRETPDPAPEDAAPDDDALVPGGPEAALEAQTTLLHEVDHRVKNNLQMIASLIVMQMRGIADEATRASLASMLERIEALSTVHRRLYQSHDVSKFDIADFVSDLVSDVVAASGRTEINKELDLAPVVISAQKATPVALMINELITNALKHAFRDRTNGSGGGTIRVKLSQEDDTIRIEVADDGVGMADAEPNGSFGTKLVRSLARQLHADIGWHDAGPGTRVSITMPNGHAVEN